MVADTRICDRQVRHVDTVVGEIDGGDERWHSDGESEKGLEFGG